MRTEEETAIDQQSFKINKLIQYQQQQIPPLRLTSNPTNIQHPLSTTKQASKEHRAISLG